MFKDLKKGYQVYTLDTSGVVVDKPDGRTRCIARAGSASVRSVTSTIAWILTCVEVVEVVTTEEQTLMTRIISGT
jgi:hypothetical protein